MMCCSLSGEIAARGVNFASYLLANAEKQIARIKSSAVDNMHIKLKMFGTGFSQLRGWWEMVVQKINPHWV